MVFYGMICFGPQWLANICKVFRGPMEYMKQSQGGIVHVKSLALDVQEAL